MFGRSKHAATIAPPVIPAPMPSVLPAPAPLVEAGAPSRFDLASDPAGIDWPAVYYHVGLAASAACEMHAELVNAGDLHPDLASDPRLAPFIREARALRERARELAANAYAFAEEQRREGGAA